MHDKIHIRWALGANVDLCIPDDAQEVALNEIANSGLVFRFLERFKTEKPKNLSPRFIAQLVCTADAWNQLVQVQLEAIREIVIYQHANGYGDIIVIKGLAPFALTGDRSMVRLSSDIDLLAQDPGFLIKWLYGQGYDGNVKPDSHEIAILWKQRVKIEIHSRFQGWSTPTSILDSFKLGHPYIDGLLDAYPWHDSFNYETLAPYCVQAVAGIADGLLVPNATMSALLTCIHAFNEYSEPGLWRARLPEIANIVDLMGSPSFCWEHFQELRASYRAEEAIRYVLAIVEYWYGSVPDNARQYSGTSFYFPCRLSHYGGWVAPYRLEDLTLPLENRPIVERLDPQLIVAAPVDQEPIYYSDSSFGERQVRIIRSIRTSSEECEPIRADFSVHWDKEGLLFHVVFPCVLPGSRSCYEVNVFGGMGDARGPGSGSRLLVGWPKGSLGRADSEDFQSGHLISHRFRCAWSDEPSILCMLILYAESGMCAWGEKATVTNYLLKIQLREATSSYHAPESMNQLKVRSTASQLAQC